MVIFIVLQISKKPKNMTMKITFNELRRVKDSLPDGSMGKIASSLNISVDTVRNYFGGTNYDSGESVGMHIEKGGPDGGIVVLDDATIFNMAQDIIQKETSN
jgi:hypothetical protein